MIETISTLFAVGGILFWFFVLLLVCVYVASVELNKHFWAICLTLVFVVVYFNTLANIKLDFRIAAASFVGYFLLGSLWSIWRWKKFTDKTIEDFNNKSEDIKKDSYNYRYLENIISPSYNKSQLISWIIYWPFSLLWNISGDFVKFLYDSISGVFEKISNNALKNVKVDKK